MSNKSIKRIIKKVLIFLRLYPAPAKRPTTLDKNDLPDIIGTTEPTMLEIGSANGEDTLEFLKLFNSPGTRLYGFEPEPKNIALIKARVHDQRFKLFEGVVSDTDGKLTFNRSRTKNPDDLSFSGSIMKPKNHLKTWDWIYFDQSVEVSSVTLDKFCRDNAVKTIDFVWCDVQGAEEKVIKGGQQAFRDKIRYFYTEYCNNELYEGQPKLKRILKLLPNFEVVKDFGADILLRNKNMP